MIQTMTLCCSKQLKELNRRNKFLSKPENKLTLFAVIATESVEIVFKQTSDAIK